MNLRRQKPGANAVFATNPNSRGFRTVNDEVLEGLNARLAVTSYPVVGIPTRSQELTAVAGLVRSLADRGFFEGRNRLIVSAATPSERLAVNPDGLELLGRYGRRILNAVNDQAVLEPKDGQRTGIARAGDIHRIATATGLNPLTSGNVRPFLEEVLSTRETELLVDPGVVFIVPVDGLSLPEIMRANARADGLPFSLEGYAGTLALFNGLQGGSVPRWSAVDVV